MTAMICGMFALQYLFIDLVKGINKTEEEKFFIFTASYDKKPIKYVIGRMLKFTLSSAFFLFFGRWQYLEEMVL